MEKADSKKDKKKIKITSSTDTHNIYSVFGNDFLLEKRYEVIEPCKILN